MNSESDILGWWDKDRFEFDPSPTPAWRCPGKRHLCIEPPRRSRDGKEEWLCVFCKFEYEDIVILPEGPEKGYVAMVMQVSCDGLVLKLVDDKPQGTFDLFGQVVGEVIKTGKKGADLAWWGGLDAQAIEKERGQVDFDKGWGRQVRKKKEKDAGDLIAEALVRAIKERGLSEELRKILGEEV